VELLKAKILEGEIDPGQDYAGVTMSFHIPIPMSWTKKATLAAQGKPHRKKFDVDNGIKGVLDAMTEAGVFPDDGQIAQCTGQKWYVREGEQPSIQFYLQAYDELKQAA